VEYSTRFSKNGIGHEAEVNLLSLLAWKGARVRRSSDYEDDRLKVDFWVGMKMATVGWKGAVPVQFSIATDEVLEEKENLVRVEFRNEARPAIKVGYASDGNDRMVCLVRLQKRLTDQVNPQSKSFSAQSAIAVLNAIVVQMTEFVEMCMELGLEMATLHAARCEYAYWQSCSEARRSA
jgi:hypothetical protein